MCCFVVSTTKFQDTVRGQPLLIWQSYLFLLLSGLIFFKNKG